MIQRLLFVFVVLAALAFTACKEIKPPLPMLSPPPASEQRPARPGESIRQRPSPSAVRDAQPVERPVTDPRAAPVPSAPPASGTP